jgi:hypothetical protein
MSLSARNMAGAAEDNHSAGIRGIMSVHGGRFGAREQVASPRKPSR